MNIEEFGMIDSTFNAGEFLTYANGLFYKILVAMMQEQLEDIHHFIGENVYQALNGALQKVKERHGQYVFKNIHIKNSIITDIEVNKNVYTIKVFLQANFKEYIFNSNSDKLILLDRFDALYQRKRNYELTFTKKATTKMYGFVKKCPSCGAPLNINDTGICDYCGTIFNQNDYDWILNKLEIS